MSKKLAIGLLLLFVVACTKKQPVKTNISNFKSFIYNNTQGVISKKSNIVVYFAKDIDTVPVGTELNTEILNISPKVKGKLVLKTKKSLVFYPEEMMLPKTRYTAKLKLNKLFSNVDDKHENFYFYFTTKTPNFSIKTKDLQSKSPSLQYIKGEVISADILTFSEAKSLINANQEGRDLKINWHGDEMDTQFDFVIDNIDRKIEDSEIEVKWDGTSIGVSENKGKSKIKIPGKNNFSVVNVYVKQFPEQHLCVNFSDPLLKDQNLKGLVSLDKGKGLKYVVQGNLLKVYPNERIAGNVNVTIFTGIKNSNGYKLAANFSDALTFEQLKPSVQLITNGLILPDSKELKFNFKAVNLKAVDVNIIKLYADNILSLLQNDELTTSNSGSIKLAGRSILRKTIPLIKDAVDNDGKWRNYALDLDDLIKADNGAIYRVELSIRKEYSLYSCEGDTDPIDYNLPIRDPIELADELEREEASWDFNEYQYYDYYGDYNWRDRDNPCTNTYYHQGKKVGSNILATNIGVIAKKGVGNSYFFAITNILTTASISNAHIELYNFQKQLISNADTNDEGIVKIDATSKAAFAIVSAEGSKAYIKLNEGNSLSLSKFNVAGKKIRKGLKGYLYGERGVWRPGDTIHTFFVLNDTDNPLPQGHPVKLEVTDPHGKLQYQKIRNNGVNGFFRFDIPTATTDATGNWTAKVKVGGATFYKPLKVETVKPNRLKINIDFKDNLLKTNKPIDGEIEVKWLHGAIAKNLKTEVKMKISSSSKGFENFPGYNFKDPIKEFHTEEITVFDSNIDVNGRAKINKKINLKNAAPGKLKASFLTRVFEKGGDFSTDVVTKEIAPFVSFVGMKSPVSKRYGNSYETDKNVDFSIATVSDDGKPVARENLEVKIYEIKWSWWWSSNSDNLAQYVNTEHRYLYKTFKASTNSDGTGIVSIKIPSSKRGRYLIRITDPKSGHSTGRTAYFFKNWWSSASGSNSEAATMLVFSSDKEKYQVGDVAEITFPSGADGNALVSVENGAEVLETQWVKTVKGQTVASIKITPNMAPNVFVNISLLQPHASVDNNLPLRLYGVIPLVVEDPATRLKPTISMPEELKPETSFEVRIAEENGKRMTYTLSVVEEGLLDLTRFRTPNLWNVFYTREALGVRTWDMFDNVIGAFGGAINQVFAIGGDENAKDKKVTKVNRFKPVVSVLGPFTLEPGATDTHRIKLPNYIGSVRTMVVAGDNTNESYGKAEQATPVRKSLMVLATLPRKLSPREKVTLPVTVFAMNSAVKDVDVQLKITNGIEIIGQYKKKVRFDKPDEKMVYFDLEVLEGQGAQKIEVIATSGSENASQEIEIDVVNPNPVTSKFVDLELGANKILTADFNCIGERGTNKVEVEMSTIPPMNFSKRIDYLIRYPHGCVEQTTSSVFPQMYLSEIFDVSVSKSLEIKNNITKGIKRLGNFQLPNGGLSYWQGNTTANDWGTSYAGHFMIEAQKKGYSLPLTFLSNWLRYQKQAARDWRPSYYYWNSGMAQSYRLYTLALAGEPDLASMNRLREYPKLSNSAKWKLASAYVLAGQKEAALQIITNASLDFGTRKDYYSYGSSSRNLAMAMETLLLLKDDRTRDVSKQLAKKLSSDDWMSTQTTAYCLLSMAKMVAQNGGKEMNITYTINGVQEHIQSQNTVAQRVLLVNESDVNKFSITNNIGNLVYVRIVNSGVLPLGNELEVTRNFKLYVKYVDEKGNPVEVSKLQQGSDFVAMVTLTNPNKEEVKDIALTQIFPSGWEIVNTRFTDFGEATDNQCDYTDIRDDRVNFYFSMKKNEVKTFTVRLNASYLGQYYLPGVQAEAMYDNDYYSRTKGQWIEVVK